MSWKPKISVLLLSWLELFCNSVQFCKPALFRVIRKKTLPQLDRRTLSGIIPGFSGLPATRLGTSPCGISLMNVMSVGSYVQSDGTLTCRVSRRSSSTKHISLTFTLLKFLDIWIYVCFGIYQLHLLPVMYIVYLMNFSECIRIQFYLAK